MAGTTHFITGATVANHGDAPPGETSEREETTVAIRWIKGKLGLRLRMIQSGARRRGSQLIERTHTGSRADRSIRLGMT